MNIQVIAQAGNEDLAKVYLAKTASGDCIEFVESTQPPFPRDEKWVLIVSPLLGCPVGCPMCDAGGWYKGKLSKEDILAQIDYMVKKRFGGNKVPVKKFKIQFARMGEPAFNPAVLEVLRELPERYVAPGLMPSISTVAPCGCDSFFERLVEIKERHYSGGHFQMQFSIHTSDEKVRDTIIPIKKWNFAEIARYGEKFMAPGDRKITLNFALAAANPISASALRDFFDPKIFFIKLTPINPTLNAEAHHLQSEIDPHNAAKNAELVSRLEEGGYEVLLSIGELEENKIGSNCGQYIKRFLDSHAHLKDSYEYEIKAVDGDSGLTD